MKFISIIKPGIIFGNLVTLLGGIFLGFNNNFDFSIFISAVIGISLIIASGCVFNNCIDQDIDAIMLRTQKRPIPKGEISVKTSIIYGFILGIIGFNILYFGTNLLATFLAFIGIFVYVLVYTPLKRKTPFSTVIGSISGAMPIVVGYCAATGAFDDCAFLLFLMLFLWQIPHSYAISIYRMDDFIAAKIPILPVIRGMLNTKVTIVFYIIIYTFVSLLLTIKGYTGYIYLVIAALLGIGWIFVSIKNFKIKDHKIWAKKVFLFSIIVITVSSLSIIVDTIFRIYL